MDKKGCEKMTKPTTKQKTKSTTKQNTKLDNVLTRIDFVIEIICKTILAVLFLIWIVIKSFFQALAMEDPREKEYEEQRADDEFRKSVYRYCHIKYYDW